MVNLRVKVALLKEKNEKLVQDVKELEDMLNSSILEEAIQRNLEPEDCVNYITRREDSFACRFCLEFYP